MTVLIILYGLVMLILGRSMNWKSLIVMTMQSSILPGR